MTFPKYRKNEICCNAASETSESTKPERSHAQVELSEKASGLKAFGNHQDSFSNHPERRLTARLVRQLCGDTSDMWLWRRLRDDSGFPRPIVIARRRYWREGDVVAWLDAQPTTEK